MQSELEAVVLALAEAVEKIGARNNPNLTEVGADFVNAMTKIDEVLGLVRSAKWIQSAAALRGLVKPSPDAPDLAAGLAEARLAMRWEAVGGAS